MCLLKLCGRGRIDCLISVQNFDFLWADRHEEWLAIEDELRLLGFGAHSVPRLLHMNVARLVGKEVAKRRRPLLQRDATRCDSHAF